MTREECKKLLPAMQHWANGGNLWWYNPSLDTWYLQNHIMYSQYDLESNGIINIIEDKHFEARKAYVLGKEIEYFNHERKWIICEPKWDNRYEYRPKKQVHEWQWYYFSDNNMRYEITKEYFVEPRCTGWIKFEPSKRIKK